MAIKDKYLINSVNSFIKYDWYQLEAIAEIINLATTCESGSARLKNSLKNQAINKLPLIP